MLLILAPPQISRYGGRFEPETYALAGHAGTGLGGDLTTTMFAARRWYTRRIRRSLSNGIMCSVT